jgi:lipoate-protein ligase A
MPIWRYIPPIAVAGHLQMAIDQWLLEQHQQGHPPTLRFYTWEPAAISLGYHQRQWSDHWKYLLWNDRPLDLVRRPTGGRAVLHQGDLTYAIVTSGLTGNRNQNYQYLCEFLLRGWRSLGVDLHYGNAGRGYIHNPNCFGTATGADLILADGFKLIGSAQLYQDKALLQHGSIRLQPDASLFQQVFGVEFVPSSLLQSNPIPPLDQIVEALKQSAATWFGVELQEQPLSTSEWDAIRRRDGLHLL